MEKYKEIFKEKKITQMGLGLLGRGVGDALFLAENGADLIVTDIKSEEELATSVKKLAKYENVTFTLGGHKKEDFIDRDVILKGPSVPNNSEHLLYAREKGIPIDMSATLFARIAQIPIIGVTGTRGKSTVTDIIQKILTVDGREVILGGNVKGVSNLHLLESVTKDSIGVFELDSWQCQGFRESVSFKHPSVLQGFIAPSIAVFTTFYPDHMNYYKGDMETYLEDKAHIFLHQQRSDTLIVGKQALPEIKKYKSKIKSNVIVADNSNVPKTWNIPLLGEHNAYNIGVAIEVARTFGVDEETIKSAVEQISAIPGRLELVRERSGVKFYNDTNSTTPEATKVAISALDPERNKNTILIAGGTDKELDCSELVTIAGSKTKATILLSGTGTEKWFTESRHKVVHSLEEAVYEALRIAGKGDTIVLSPGFASFGMFNNEYDRGEQYNSIVKSLE